MEWIAPTVAIIVVLVVWSLVGQIQVRLARVEQKLNQLLKHAGIEAAASTPLSDRVKSLADDPARKIEAIKVFREETGAGLAEAKAAVEAYMNGG